MIFFILRVEYKGTDFSGWQIQPNEKTIQGELNKALNEIAKKPVRTIGASRTDAGVHAFDQIVRVKFPFEINKDALKKGLNSILPDSIQIKSCELTNEDFHPLKNIEKKTYIYRFSKKRLFPAFNELVLYYPYDLDMELMIKGCDLFIGKKDFLNYYTTGSVVHTTIREVLSCAIVRVNQDQFFGNHDIYELRIEGKGFLKQMVRLIMGTLFNLGRGKIDLKLIEDSFSVQKENKPGFVVPAHGLYLKEIIIQ